MNLSKLTKAQLIQRLESVQSTLTTAAALAADYANETRTATGWIKDTSLARSTTYGQCAAWLAMDLGLALRIEDRSLAMAVRKSYAEYPAMRDDLKRMYPLFTFDGLDVPATPMQEAA